MTFSMEMFGKQNIVEILKLYLLSPFITFLGSCVPTKAEINRCFTIMGSMTLKLINIEDSRPFESKILDQIQRVLDSTEMIDFVSAKHSVEKITYLGGSAHYEGMRNRKDENDSSKNTVKTYVDPPNFVVRNKSSKTTKTGRTIFVVIASCVVVVLTVVGVALYSRRKRKASTSNQISPSRRQRQTMSLNSGDSNPAIRSESDNELLIIEDGFGFSSESSGSDGSDSNDALENELRILEYGSDPSNHDSTIFDSTTKTKADSLSSSANNESPISTTVMCSNGNTKDDARKLDGRTDSNPGVPIMSPRTYDSEIRIWNDHTLETILEEPSFASLSKDSSADL